MSKKIFSTIASMALVSSISAGAIASEGKLPAPYQDVFKSSMDDPAVMIYFGDKAFKEGEYADSMRWMLSAAEYNHPAAIENVKHLIKNNLGTYENRDRVVSFLTYYAEPEGDRNPDVFAQVYLADYYRGDDCVWFAAGEKADCKKGVYGETPASASDLKLSYYYYDGAAEQGDVRSKYSSAMMTILGLGVPRNVPEGLNELKEIAESGNPHVAFIVGEIYQQGYWMPQDRRAASVWFQESANADLPVAKLSLAKNLEAGVIRDMDESTRIARAVSLYESVSKSILSNQSQKSEALYRLGLLHANHGMLKNKDSAIEYMSKAAKYEKPNEYAAMALVWQGDRLAEVDLKGAVSFYESAALHLEEMPLDVQQRHAVVWQKIAYAYARGGDANLSRDERRFSDFMNKHHEVLSETFIPQSNHFEFAGYSAFQFPG
jgi:TPR repeat protein